MLVSSRHGLLFNEWPCLEASTSPSRRLTFVRTSILWTIHVDFFTHTAIMERRRPGNKSHCTIKHPHELLPKYDHYHGHQHPQTQHKHYSQNVIASGGDLRPRVLLSLSL